jgi:chemotaxis protein methyltransferase CheR
MLQDRYEHLTFVGDHPEVRRGGDRRPGGGRTVQGAHVLDGDSAAFFGALCSLWGLEASHYRDSIFARRKSACLRALGVTSPVEGLGVISRDRRAAERALGTVMIGVTELFRDAAVFQSLGGLLRGLKRPGQSLRALSVGCSDGSELYSLAILLAEQGLLPEARLTGMDARPAAIEVARAGVYPAAALAMLSPVLRSRYFAPVPAAPRRGRNAGFSVPQVQAHDSLRNACQWTAADAFSLGAGGEGAGQYDLVLCRNVAIYLKPEAAAALWALCIAQVRPGGLMVAGKAERPPVDVRAELTLAGPCIYRRRLDA